MPRGPPRDRSVRRQARRDAAAPARGPPCAPPRGRTARCRRCETRLDRRGGSSQAGASGRLRRPRLPDRRAASARTHLDARLVAASASRATARLARDLLRAAPPRWVDEGYTTSVYVRLVRRPVDRRWFRLRSARRARSAMRRTARRTSRRRSCRASGRRPAIAARRPARPGAGRRCSRRPSFSGTALPPYDEALAESRRRDDDGFELSSPSATVGPRHFAAYRRPPDLRVRRTARSRASVACPRHAAAAPGARSPPTIAGPTRGYTAMTTDWRVTNLLASRFWPKRGFRTTFLRLNRSIPSRSPCSRARASRSSTCPRTASCCGRRRPASRSRTWARPCARRCGSRSRARRSPSS